MTTRVQAWLRQAESDLAVSQLTDARRFHSQACYHYGQAAEKALKGVLISLGVLPPHSHSSAQARTIAESILMFVKSILNPEDNV